VGEERSGGVTENGSLEREAYHTLYPAYGPYLGSAGGYAYPRYSNPIYLGEILAGHAIGRWRAPKDEP